MTLELSKTFQPREVEARVLKRWDQGGYFEVSAADVESGGHPYVIVIPPPNVTAVLHMGHGLNNTIQDVLIRWQRMRGRAALWVPGTDHAGIATQNVVERRLAEEGTSREDLGREAFERRVWDHVDVTGNRILNQLKAIGCSCDWSRSRFTLDQGLSTAVREMFVCLYDDELIYRGKYIINWCPRCLTALSNEEAEATPAEGSLWHLRYPVAPEFEGAARQARLCGADAVGQLPDGRWYLTVSTTRPETMLGDTAVAVAPGDVRYQSLVGARVELPLTGRTIPLIEDPHVSSDFGTGMVKITPAHDLDDFEVAGRTGLELLNVMTDDGRMNDEVPPGFRGLPREEARDAVVARLDDAGLLAGREDHTHAIPHCYRCDTVVEPRLSEQWFVRMRPLAQRALEASREGRVTFSPGRWTKVYEQWMENIRDWCISRQLWWGHRIPVWYCDACGEVMVVRNNPPRCQACGSRDLRRDPDVLDTWFSSWLWPFSVFGWPEKTRDLKAFYPGHALSTAPEILFFWVARMVMAGQHAMGDVPFERVYLHGTVRDKQGRKMSKSLGNGVDPLEVAEEYGADALRFTLLASAGVGADIRLDHEDLDAAFAPGRNFVNKLWNAGRFALMSVGQEPVGAVEETSEHWRLEDRWIMSRLQHAIDLIDGELEAFRMQGAVEVARDFFRGELADWYLESIKGRLQSGGAGRDAARSVLVHVLDAACRLLHPLIPFVTEELWGLLPRAGRGETGSEGAKKEVLAVACWPLARDEWVDPEAEAEFAWLKELIVRVRALRKEYGVGEGRRVVLHIVAGSGAGVTERCDDILLRLAGIRAVEYSAPLAGQVSAGSVMRDGTELFVPLEGVIDVEAERTRLLGEIERLRARRQVIEKKLSNESFLTRAPSHVVGRERDKLSSCALQLTKWEAKLSVLGGNRGGGP